MSAITCVLSFGRLWGLGTIYWLTETRAAHIKTSYVFHLCPIICFKAAFSMNFEFLAFKTYTDLRKNCKSMKAPIYPCSLAAHTVNTIYLPMPSLSPIKLDYAKSQKQGNYQVCGFTVFSPPFWYKSLYGSKFPLIKTPKMKNASNNLTRLIKLF